MLKIAVTQANPIIDSYLGTEVIKVTIRSKSIFSHNDTITYVEPFIYVDGGIYDSEGTLVDAGYYDTALWAITYNGGYA